MTHHFRRSVRNWQKVFCQKSTFVFIAGFCWLNSITKHTVWNLEVWQLPTLNWNWNSSKCREQYLNLFLLIYFDLDFVAQYRDRLHFWHSRFFICMAKIVLLLRFQFDFYTKSMKLAMDFFIYGRNCCQFFLTDFPTWGGNLRPKLHPGGGFFGPWYFIILKNSHQELSNEGSIFILSSLEVGHWVAQT